MLLDRPQPQIVGIYEEYLIRAAEHGEILAPACLTVCAEDQVRARPSPHILAEHKGALGDKAGLRILKGI